MPALNPPHFYWISGTTDELKLHLIFVLNEILFSLLCYLVTFSQRGTVSVPSSNMVGKQVFAFVSSGFIHKPMAARTCWVRSFSWEKSE